MIPSTGSFLWKWSSPERIFKTLPFFIYKFSEHMYSTKSGTPIRIPTPTQLPRPWEAKWEQAAPGQPWQGPLGSCGNRLRLLQSWALSRSSPASLGRVMWACPHSRNGVLGFSTGTAISWEHKAGLLISAFPGLGPDASAIG